MKTRQKACDTPLCNTISTGCCAIWGGYLALGCWAQKGSRNGVASVLSLPVFLVGFRKTHKHKQIWGIVPRLDGRQEICWCVFFLGGGGHSWLGRKSRYMNSERFLPPNCKLNFDPIFCLIFLEIFFLLFWEFFESRGVPDQNWPEPHSPTYCSAMRCSMRSWFGGGGLCWCHLQVPWFCFLSQTRQQQKRYQPVLPLCGFALGSMTCR